MFTTLLEDDTDTLFASGLDTIKRLQPGFPAVGTRIEENARERRIERFNNLDIGSVTLGTSADGGALIFKPGASGSFFTLKNTLGALELARKYSEEGTPSNFMSLSEEGEFTLLPLKKGTAVGDTTELVPVVVDADGKIGRGFGLYQTITAGLSDLSSRVAVLESTTAPVLSSQISTRLSDLETLGQKIRVRLNGMQVFSSPI